jgi:AraC-like DNA-binding protein
VPWSSQPSDGLNSQVLHAGTDVVLGRFRCVPGDPLWHTENVVAHGDLLVLPGTAVLLSRGRERIVADRNRAVLYADGLTYRRALVHPTGDDCVFVRISPALVEELRSAGGAVPSPGSWLSAEIPDEDYARQRVLSAASSGRRDAQLSAEAIEEEVLGLVAMTCRRGTSNHRPRGSAEELADSVRLVLGSRPAHVRWTLGEIPLEIGYSVFHMSRLFRDATGSTVHAYAERLRLRAAFDRVVGGERDLAQLGNELGFASHSHFTSRFRRAFGFPPSALRSRART